MNKKNLLLLVWLLPLATCIRYDDSLGCTGECSMGQSLGAILSFGLAILLTGVWVAIKGKK